MPARNGFGCSSRPSSARLWKALRLSAALLIGPMIAGVIVASAAGRIRVPDTIFAATQGIIACMIARAMPVSIVDEVAMQWPVFGLGVMSTIVMALSSGGCWRWQVLPGTSASGAPPWRRRVDDLLASSAPTSASLPSCNICVLCVTSIASLVASAANNIRQPRSFGFQQWIGLSFAGAGRGLAGPDFGEGLPSAPVRCSCR
jgi:hypothetical protein